MGFTGERIAEMSRYPTLLNSNTLIGLQTDGEPGVAWAESWARILQLDRADSTQYMRVASLVKNELLSIGGASLSLQEILDRWEVRLVAMVLACGGEGVVELRSVKLVKKEVDILVPELMRINKMRRHHALAAGGSGVAPGSGGASLAPLQNLQGVFPREVTPRFKFLLLRIKHGASLVLVNDYYAHIWRTPEMTQLDLSRTSFSVLAVLIARQDFATLLNFIDSILAKLPPGLYYDQLVIIYTLASSIRALKEDKVLSNDLQWHVSIDALHGLNYVLNQVPPIYNDPDSVLVSSPQLYDSLTPQDQLELLKTQVKDLQITGRILCGFCAYCELIIDPPSSPSADKVQDLLHTINKHWLLNVTKYYCLE